MENRLFRPAEKFHLAAKQSSLNYIIIGGFAASYWGKPRFTADVDYVVEDQNFEKVKQVLTSINYKLEFLHPKASFAHFSSIDNNNIRIDFMFVDSNTWNKLWNSVNYADFGGSDKYPVVDPLHLIAMKLHSAKQPDREDYFKDINDIVEIIIAQNYNFLDQDLNDIISTHGTAQTIELLKKIYESRQERSKV